MQQSHVKSSVGSYSAVRVVWAGTAEDVNSLSDLNPLPSLSSGELMQEKQKESAFWDYFLILRTAHEVVVSFGCWAKSNYIYSLEQRYIVWTRAAYWTVVTSLLRDICQQSLKSKHADINRNLETSDKMCISNYKQRSLHWHCFIQSKILVATVSKLPHLVSNQ